MTEQSVEWFDEQVEICQVDNVPYTLPPSYEMGSFNFYNAIYRDENGDEKGCFVEKETLCSFFDTDDDPSLADSILQRSKREVGILRSLSKKNPHVYQCIDIVRTQQSVHRIYEEQLPCYSLHSTFTNSASSFTQNAEALRSIMYQLFTVLDDCHSQRIVHGQIQPSSMLVIPKNSTSGSKEITFHLKLANFDRARTFYETDPFEYNHHKCLSTSWFQAPEILLSETESRDALEASETDVWAAGVTLAHLSMNNTPLFPGDCEFSTLLKIFRQLGTPNANLWPEATQLPYYNAEFPKWNAIPFHKDIRNKLREEGCHLIQKMLSLNPSKRPTVKECMRHAYFRGLIVTKHTG